MASTDTSPFGRGLRQWRRLRGTSQLDLASTAGTTTRHLSFLETGRSRPSRRMVERLRELIPRQAFDVAVQAAIGGLIHERLLAEGGYVVRSGIQAIEELSGPVRRTLRDLVHNRKNAWPLKRFLPGLSSAGSPDRLRRGLPTEEDSGPDPP